MNNISWLVNKAKYAYAPKESSINYSQKEIHKKLGLLKFILESLLKKAISSTKSGRLSMAELKFIQVRGAREHNLKSVDVDILRGISLS